MTNNNHYDVIVVGVGAMGSATCYALAQRGVRVLGLEQYDIPHGLGSSGGYSRLIRLAYYEHPDYVPLLRRAYEGWDQLSQEHGSAILYRTGGVYLGPSDGSLIAGSVKAAHEHTLDYEMLDAQSLQSRFGPFAMPEHFHALYEPDAGFVLSERAIAAFAEKALRRGAVLRGREPVRRWDSDDSGVTVETDHGTYHGGHLVLTAGAWTTALVQDLGVELTVTRQVLGWVWPRTPERFELGAFPCWAVEDDAPGRGGIYYGFPMMPELPGIKVARHQPGPKADPDALDRTPTMADEHEFRPALRRYLPDADGTLLSLRMCMYTVSPDHHFLVDRHPDKAHVTIACGFSGHGFKFAPAMGAALADLATEGKTELPVAFLNRDRLGKPVE